MSALEKKKVNTSTIDDGGSHTGDSVGQCQNKLQGSGSSTSRSSCSENEDNPNDLIRKEFNFCETSEDGTALGIARKHNHVDIIEYLSRFT